jgi:cardiolipin synthase (CMP-forming)
MAMSVNIPNLITLGRVILVPVVLWLLISGRNDLAFFGFLAAGFIAKRYHLQTELGAYLDPLADKLLLVSIFVTLGAEGELPSWLVIAVVSRDILIVTAIVLSWLMGRPVVIRPFAVSKANTLAQILLAGIVLAALGFGWKLTVLRTVMVWLTAALTLASLGAYLDAWLRHMSQYESTETKRPH